MKSIFLALILSCLAVAARDLEATVSYAITVKTNNRYQAQETALWGDYGKAFKGLTITGYDSILNSGKYDVEYWVVYVTVKYSGKKRDLNDFYFYSTTGLPWAFTILDIQK